jgi:hypothetical protein
MTICVFALITFVVFALFFKQLANDTQRNHDRYKKEKKYAVHI